MQSLNLAMMRAGGAMVRQHMKDLQVQQPLQVNRSSMLQLLQHDKFDEKGPDEIETDFDGATIGGNNVRVDNGTRLENDASLEHEFDDAQIGKVKAGSGSELDGAISGELDSREVPVDGRINSHDPPNVIVDDGQVGLGQTTNAVDSGPKEKEEEHVPPLGPGEEMKMFRVANSKVGEMEERAKTMQGKLTDVDAAWGRVDGKLTSYGESIEDLKSQLSKLTESSHGLHGEVKEEFHGKEKFRMCSFVNAARVLKGQPEIDCNSIDDITD
jgi:hypothetical protein